MMRVPPFQYEAPSTIAEAAKILRDEPSARILAGGTDLLPNMKRRQQTPRVVVSLRGISALRALRISRSEVEIGASATLAEVETAKLPPSLRALGLATSKVATPPIRNMATLGGNLCLDTRCNYYDQNWEWRKAIGFCKKAPAGEALVQVDGGTCWVATSSARCLAVSSTDSAPALMALGAHVALESRDGKRLIPVGQLFHDDGMAFLTKKRDEILTAVHVPSLEGWKSTYWKLRRRGSFDFPVLGVAAAVRLEKGVVAEARVVLGAVASRPLPVDTSTLVGKPLDDATIEAFAGEALKLARPLDNTDFALSWRKKTTRAYVTGALRELRGDDLASLGLLARTAARLVPLATV